MVFDTLLVDVANDLTRTTSKLFGSNPSLIFLLLIHFRNVYEKYLFIANMPVFKLMFYFLIICKFGALYINIYYGYWSHTFYIYFFARKRSLIIYIDTNLMLSILINLHIHLILLNADINLTFRFIYILTRTNFNNIFTFNISILILT